MQPNRNVVKPENRLPGSQDKAKKLSLDQVYCSEEVHKQPEGFLQVIEPAQRA